MMAAVFTRKINFNVDLAMSQRTQRERLVLAKPQSSQRAIRVNQ